MSNRYCDTDAYLNPKNIELGAGHRWIVSYVALKIKVVNSVKVSCEVSAHAIKCSIVYK